MQYIHIYIYIYMHTHICIWDSAQYVEAEWNHYFKRKKERNYIFPTSDFRFPTSGKVKPFTKQACRESVVASFFPLKTFTPLCFTVLSTGPRENRLADTLLCSKLVEYSTIIRHGKIPRHLLHKEYSASNTKWLFTETHRKKPSNFYTECVGKLTST